MAGRPAAMASLILGPIVRYVGTTEATVWMETDSRCEVEVLGHRAATFHVGGRHYALVAMTGLKPGSSTPYDMQLDGVACWPPPGSGFPPSRIQTLPETGPVTIAFGSCRVAAPQEPPYTLQPEEHELGLGLDALDALALRLRDQDPAAWPRLLLMIGDQVYADEVSPETRSLIRARRDVSVEPGEEVLDFEEYTWLYREAWSPPALRWLLSTLPTAMIFDDHDVHDDWNIWEAWTEAVCDGAWGKLAARIGEKVRRVIDLEHWAAFQDSFHRLVHTLQELASGRRGRPPASIVLLGGDIHQAYVAEVAFQTCRRR